MVQELKEYHALYASLFRDDKQRFYSYHYLAGLLDSEVKRKSAENLALATIGPERVRNMQHFVGTSRWKDDEIRAEHRLQTGLTLGKSDGVIILDGSDCAKQGNDSVGVQRQWCGELGKVANCQAGVYLGYSSDKGYTLLDRRLYMPECWFTPEYADRRYKCHVPATVHFQTKNELAWEMIEQLSQAKTLPACWITMDEAFGRDTTLLDRIHQETDYFYLAEVPKDTYLWAEEPETFVPEYEGRGRPPSHCRLAPDAPAPQTVAEIASQLPEDAWSLHSLKEGSKGLIIAEIAIRRMVPVRDGLPGSPVWLVLRRSPTDPTDFHAFLCNASQDITHDEMIQVCALRWPIETMFELAKQFLGLNEYETRSWFGWHHHMTLVILAFGFLARCQLRLTLDAPALTVPQIVELLKAVLPKPDFDADTAIELIRYKQLRIARAKDSHYRMQKKRTIDKLIATQ